MVGFIRGEMQGRVQDGYSIILPTDDAVHIFGESLKLSHITAVPQSHHQPRLILNLSENSDKVMPSVNNTTDRDIALEKIHFGRALPHTLNAIWETDPAEGPIGV